ncbi:MAG TPA: hypothetical protein O0X43_03265, partial [Methanocorpusculum sp.]|nr:hypothetical protein [Methanocorpusculum sp.]
FHGRCVSAERTICARNSGVYSGGRALTDPIVGDWEKSMMLVGRMYCRFYPDNTGIAIGKVLGHDINEPFQWTCKGNGVYHICAAGYEHDIHLTGDRLETVFRGYALDMARVTYKK